MDATKDLHFYGLFGEEMGRIRREWSKGARHWYLVRQSFFILTLLLLWRRTSARVGPRDCPRRSTGRKGSARSCPCRFRSLIPSSRLTCTPSLICRATSSSIRTTKDSASVALCSSTAPTGRTPKTSRPGSRAPSLYGPTPLAFSCQCRGRFASDSTPLYLFLVISPGSTGVRGQGVHRPGLVPGPGRLARCGCGWGPPLAGHGEEASLGGNSGSIGMHLTVCTRNREQVSLSALAEWSIREGGEPRSASSGCRAHPSRPRPTRQPLSLRLPRALSVKTSTSILVHPGATHIDIPRPAAASTAYRQATTTTSPCRPSLPRAPARPSR